MDPEEKRIHRNEVIDECILMVRSYNERAHRLASVRAHMGGASRFPTSVVGAMVTALSTLKRPPPLRVTLRDVTPTEEPPEGSEGD